MTENFLKLISDTKPKIQEAQRTPRKINAKKTISKHIIFKLQKLKINKKSWKKPEEKNTLPTEEQR